MVNLLIASLQAVPPAVLRRPSRGCPPRAPLRRYPTPSCDACPAPAKVARLRAPPGWGARTMNREPFLARFIYGRQRFASPAASDMADSYRPDARPNPYLSILCYLFIHPTLRYSFTVICGRRIGLFDWQAGTWWLRERKSLNQNSPERRCFETLIVG